MINVTRSIVLRLVAARIRQSRHVFFSRFERSRNSVTILLLDSIVVEFVLLSVILLRDSSINQRPVERINIGNEDHVVEMPHHDRQSSKDRFVEMNRKRHIDDPSRKKAEH